MNINMVRIPVRSGSLRGFSGVLRFSENLNISDGWQPGLGLNTTSHYTAHKASDKASLGHETPLNTFNSFLIEIEDLYEKQIL